MEWTQCPECGLVAEVVARDVWDSTDGPVEHIHVRCVDRHRFVLPVEVLARHHVPEPRRAQVAQSPLVRVRARRPAGDL